MHCSNCGKKVEETTKFCQNCGEQIGTQDNSIAVEYYAISLKRLVLFSILTFGIYEIYWFYKNWQAVKKFQGEDIYPFWRAIFTVLFCYSLFKKVLESAKKHTYQDPYSPGWLATAYIFLLLIGNSLSSVDSYGIGFNIIWLIVVVSTFIPLLPVQKAINFNNRKINSNLELKKDFSGSEVILIVIGVLWSLLVLWGTFLP
jgi:predicted nucleic acid-binding Zn ribbon protein